MSDDRDQALRDLVEWLRAHATDTRAWMATPMNPFYEDVAAAASHRATVVETTMTHLSAAERVVEALRQYDTAIRTGTALPAEYREALAAYDQATSVKCTRCGDAYPDADAAEGCRDPDCGMRS